MGRSDEQTERRTPGSAGLATHHGTERILVPSRGPEDWKGLAQREEHWRPGASAWALAHAWSAADGLPPEVQRALSTAFPDVEMLLAVPEWRTSLPGPGSASHSDVWALCRTGSSLASVAVEGKVEEPFGPTVGEWLRGASQAKLERLAYLCHVLGLEGEPSTALRYQLFHRTASAILEAERFGAAHAVMLVHSFHKADRWFEDFAAFADALGVRAEKEKLVAVPVPAPCTLHVGWTRGEARFLE